MEADGRVFQSRVTEGKKECRWGVALGCGTRSFCCCPLVGLAVVVGILSANVSTSPILILYSKVTLSLKSLQILLADRRWTISRVLTRFCWWGSHTGDEYSSSRASAL